ncbi:hypothetical protein [Saccharopolyspora sp. NPDC002376]
MTVLFGPAAFAGRRETFTFSRVHLSVALCTLAAVDDEGISSEDFEDPEEWDDSDQEPEGLNALFKLAPLIPGHMLVPVVERLGLSVVEALHQPWLEVRSDRCAYDAFADAVSCDALVDAVVEGRNPDLIREVLGARPLAGEWTLRRVAAGLNDIGDPQLAEIAAEVYAHSDATSAIRHSLARGPLGPAMAECLLADNTPSPLHLRPLLATGDPEVARRLLRLPAASVTRGEQAQAAMLLLERGLGGELEELLRPVPGHGKPGVHIVAELDAAFAEGVPAGSEAPRVAALRRVAEEAQTPRQLGRLLAEHLTGERQPLYFVLHSPHLHDLNALVGAALPRKTRQLLVSGIREECPSEIGRSLLDHRDVADDPDAALVTPRQVLQTAPAEDVVGFTAPVGHLAELLDPTRDQSLGWPIDLVYRAQLNVALNELLKDVSPEALLGAARMGPGFDGTLPELLATGAAQPDTADLTPEGAELLHLLLHFAPAETVREVLSRVSGQDALGLARHAAVWLTGVPVDDKDKDADLRPYRSVLCAIARARSDLAVRDMLADTAVQAAGDTGMTDAAEFLLVALDAGDVPGVRELAGHHLPDAEAWLAQSERRRRIAREEMESPEVGLAELLAMEPAVRRVHRPRTPVAWEEVISFYRSGDKLTDEALVKLVHRPDFPHELQPLFLQAHPELCARPPLSGNHHHELAPPRWLLREVLPHWDRIAPDVRSSSLINVVQRRLVDAEDLLGQLAPAWYAADVLETVQDTVVELVPRCRELIAARIPRADVETWALAVKMLTGGYSGTVMDLLAAAAATGTPVDGEKEPTT